MVFRDDGLFFVCGMSHVLFTLSYLHGVYMEPRWDFDYGAISFFQLVWITKRAKQSTSLIKTLWSTCMHYTEIFWCSIKLFFSYHIALFDQHLHTLLCKIDLFYHWFILTSLMKVTWHAFGQYDWTKNSQQAHSMFEIYFRTVRKPLSVSNLSRLWECYSNSLKDNSGEKWTKG